MTVPVKQYVHLVEMSATCLVVLLNSNFVAFITNEEKEPPIILLNLLHAKNFAILYKL